MNSDSDSRYFLSDLKLKLNLTAEKLESIRSTCFTRKKSVDDIYDRYCYDV